MLMNNRLAFRDRVLAATSVALIVPVLLRAPQSLFNQAHLHDDKFVISAILIAIGCTFSIQLFRCKLKFVLPACIFLVLKLFLEVFYYWELQVPHAPAFFYLWDLAPQFILDFSCMVALFYVLVVSTKLNTNNLA